MENLDLNILELFNTNGSKKKEGLPTNFQEEQPYWSGFILSISALKL
jgi:hypothetical protein